MKETSDENQHKGNISNVKFIIEIWTKFTAN